MRGAFLSGIACFVIACGGSDDAAQERPGSGGAGGSSAGSGGGNPSDASFPTGGTSGGGAAGSAAGGGAGTASGGTAGSSGGSSGTGGGATGGAGGTGTGGGGTGGACGVQQFTQERHPKKIVSEPTGSQPWTNPQNASTSDDSRATSPGLAPGKATERLVATDFGFLLPASASIVGFQVFLEQSQGGTGTAKDQTLRLLKGGAPVPADPIKTGAWTATDEEKTYGGATDTWGTSWTAAEVTAANFGIRFRAQNTHTTNNVNPRVDAIRIRVHYTADPCAL